MHEIWIHNESPLLITVMSAENQKGINPIAPYSIACGVLAWPDRFSYCAACLGWSNSSTEYTLKAGSKWKTYYTKFVQ